MNKQRQLVRLALFVLVALLALPGFVQRIARESDNMGVCLSVDYASLAADFDDIEIRDSLSYARNKGIGTVSIGVDEAQSEAVLENISGFDIALFIDEYTDGFSYAELACVLYSRHSLRHISVCADGFVGSAEYDELMSFISDKKINFIFMENKSQSANEGGFDRFPYTETASYMRCYNTLHSANGKLDPERRFHQMLNSFKDRNTRFINIVPFEDKSATASENFYASIEASELFIDEVERVGCPTDGFAPDYSGYGSNTAFNMALAAVLSILLCHAIFELLTRRVYVFIDALAVVASITFALLAYLFTSFAQLVFPLMLAVSMACFIITALLLSAKAFKGLGFAAYVSLELVFLVSMLSLVGFFLSSVLSGVEYYMYFYTFRGVKLALFIPIIYAIAVFVFIFDIKFKKIKINAKVIFASVFIGAVFAAMVTVYLMRSGNSAISDMETVFRNTIDSLMGIRPRTKEFLIGYPAFVLALWYFKHTKSTLLPLLMSAGISILVGSVINSFCHVFTPCISIYHRSLNGLVLSVPISLVALAANSAICKIFLKK